MSKWAKDAKKGNMLLYLFVAKSGVLNAKTILFGFSRQ